MEIMVLMEMMVRLETALDTTLLYRDKGFGCILSMP
jgi:hypothetical protein